MPKSKKPRKKKLASGASHPKIPGMVTGVPQDFKRPDKGRGNAPKPMSQMQRITNLRIPAQKNS